MTHIPDRQSYFPPRWIVGWVAKLALALTSLVVLFLSRSSNRHESELVNDLERRIAELAQENEHLRGQIAGHEQTTKRLLEERDLMRTLLDIFPDTIYVKDREGRFTLVNRAVLKQFGHSNFREVIGKTDHDFVLPEIANRYQADDERILRTGHIVTGKEELSQSQGQLRWVMTTKVPLRDSDDNIIGIVGVSRDITERKNAEMVLRQAHDELERRVADRTAELSKANLDLQAEVAERKLAELAEREQRVLADALRDTASALNRTLNLDEVLERILVQVQRVLPHDSSSIMLVEDDVAHVVHSRGLIEHGVSRDFLAALRFPLRDYANLHIMMETGQPFLVADTNAKEEWQPVEETSWIQSSLGAPIRIEGEVIGFLHLDSSLTHAFNTSDAEKLLAFADQAAVAIHNARLYDAVRRHVDELEVRVAERTAELERERAQLLTILDAMTEGVVGIMYDKTGQPALRYVNQAFSAMLGYAADEWDMIHLPVAHVSQQQVARIVQNYSQTMLTDGFWQQELTLLCKDGTELDASITVTWVNDQDGTVIGEVTVIRDISHEKVLDEQRSRFVANASHELRTPITNVLTRLYLLHKQPERLGEHLQVLESVAVRMRNLVEDLLEYSRFERGVIPLKPVVIDLQQLVVEVIRVQQSEADKKQINLTYRTLDFPLQIMADPDRMTQVFTNLVTNAINYTPEEGTVEIRFVPETTGSNPPTVAIQIRDSGVGIQPEYQPYIFEPFYRVSERNRGTGLGLSITKEIVQMHGGNITVESELGGGSCFTVRLNLVKAVM